MRGDTHLSRLENLIEEVKNSTEQLLRRKSTRKLNKSDDITPAAGGIMSRSST